MILKRIRTKTKLKDVLDFPDDVREFLPQSRLAGIKLRRTRMPRGRTASEEALRREKLDAIAVAAQVQRAGVATKATKPATNVRI